MWGVILIAVAIIAMMGVLFTMPQYFQGVAGTDAMGSGLRLLPLVGGLVAGAIPADRVARSLGREAHRRHRVRGARHRARAGLGDEHGLERGVRGRMDGAFGAGMGLALATPRPQRCRS